MSTEERLHDVCLLGACAVSAPTVSAAFPDRGYQLVAFLILRQGLGPTRHEAASLLWPDAPTSKSRANLRQLISRMNRAVPGIIVQSDSEHLILAEDRSIDLREITRGLDDETPEARRMAVLGFSGPLLQGLSDPSPAFTRWRERQEGQLKSRLVEAAVSILNADTRYGFTPIESFRLFCDRALSVDTQDRRVRIAVGKAYARVGDYERAERTLTEDGFASHDAEATALVRRLSASRAHALPAAPSVDKAIPTKIPRVALMRPRALDSAPTALLADRLVEELAFGLARYRSFSVLAPFSSFSVTDQYGLPRDNSLLRADYAVSGDIEQTTDEVSLRLRLTHVETRAIFWSAEFPLTRDGFGRSLRLLMSRVVMSVADELERRVRDDLRMTTAPSALLHFLEGRALQVRCDLPHVRRARSEFSRALVIDEGFAPAHARIAETMFVEWILCGGTDPELLSAARLRADQAVRLEPSGPTGHWVSGAVALYQRRWDRVNEAYAEAESLAPHDADMLLEYADALSHLGDHEAAEAKLAAALNLNPMAPVRYRWFGASIAFNRGDFLTAAERCDLIEDRTVALGLRTATYAISGRMDDAKKWARRLRETLPGLAIEDLLRISPDRDGTITSGFYREGLRMAGMR
jgi:DNA-binding SARP family transcriptional activator/TolB-like protein